MKHEIHDVLQAHERHRDSLIPILQGVQKQLGYLSPEAVAAVASHLGLSESEIFGVATFYTQFRFTAPGAHIIKVCRGTACHVRGSHKIMDEVTRTLGIEPGQTTPDGKFSLESIACFGSCALSPVVVIDDTLYGRMTPQKVKQLLKTIP